MIHPHLPYAVTEAYLAVFAVTIWLRMDRSIGSEHEIRQLRYMIYAYLSMLATDIVWAFMEDGLIRLPLFWNSLDNAITIISVSCGCYFWFRFIEDRAHIALGKTWDALLAIPLMIVIVLDLISISAGWLFFIDAQGKYQNTRMFDIQSIINYIYLLIPTSYSIFRAANSKYHQERTEYYTYALYMVAPLISGLLEDIFPLVPLLALNIFLMILILFLMIQNMQIYNDALTGLNNRRRLDQYIEECLAQATVAHPFQVFLLDINDFKQINDVYGHLQGDQALKQFASVLKRTVARHRAFAARYGGDEFCLVIKGSPAEAQAVSAEIHQDLRAAQAGKVQQYELTVSVGSVSADGTETGPKILARADQALYSEKKKWHNDLPKAA